MLFLLKIINVRRYFFVIVFCIGHFVSIASAADNTPLANTESLRGAFELARQNDPLYLAGVSEFEGNKFSAKAAGMAYYPQIRASSSQLEIEAGARRNSLSLVQPLLSTDKLASLREKEPRLRLADASFALSEIDLAKRLFAAFSEVVVAREGLQQNKARLTALEQQQLAAQRLSALEMGTLTDVRDAEVRLLKARGEDLRLRGQLEQSEKRYLSIVGQLAPKKVINLNKGKLSRLPDLASDAYQRSQASGGHIEQNPSVIVSRQLKDLADIAAFRARSAWVPEVSAVHTLSAINGNNNQFTGISVSMPLDAGKFGAIQVAGAMATKAAQEVRNAERQTLLEIDRLNSVVKYGAGEFLMYQAAVEAAEFSVLANEKSFKGGVRSIVDVLNSIEALYIAKSDLVKSLMTLSDGLLNLWILEGASASDSLAEVEQILF